MNKKTKVAIYFLLLLGVGLIFFLFPDDSFARAGGRIGRRTSLWFLVIFGPFIAIYCAVITYYLVKKKKECKVLLEKIQNIDPVWSPDNLKSRVEETFFKVQEAWMERDQDIAKDYVSERLYRKHKMQTDRLLQLGHKNIMHNISLNKATIVEVADYRDDSKDAFIAHIDASMIDYVVDENSGAIIEGEKERTSFEELWKFKRINNNWYLDEIDSDVSISDLSELMPFSEENA